MSKEEMIVRRWKLYNIDYSNPEISNKWLEKFDKSFYSYQRNEFDLKEKRNALMNNVSSIYSSINKNDIFYTDFEVNFGEYDFNKEEFSFKPFREARDKKGNISEFFEEIGFEYADYYLNCSIWIENSASIPNLSMNKIDAAAFLKKRTSNGYYPKVDRKVYCRLYYVVNPSLASTTSDKVIYGYGVKFDVFADQCRTELISTSQVSNPFTTEAEYGNPMKRLAASNNSQNNLKYFPDCAKEISYGNLNLANWSQPHPDKCETGYFIMNGRIKKEDMDQRTMSLLIHTNYYYIMQPGYEVAFVSTITGQNYPLVVNRLSQISGSGFCSVLQLDIKVTKKTLEAMINAKINSITIQIAGNPKYNWTGEPKYNLDETINTRLNVIGTNYTTDSNGNSETVNNFLKIGL